MTNVPSFHPAIAALRKQVEQHLGCTISSLASVRMLVDALHYRVNEDTIMRLWKIKDASYRSVRRSTLDTLSQYVGANDWDAFVAEMQTAEGTESQLHPNDHTIIADRLAVGTQLRLSWLPDRQCILCYQGDYRWLVTESLHSSTLHVGDTVCCRTFTLGRELYLDSVIHDQKEVGAYRIGTHSGLTSVEVLV